MISFSTTIQKFKSNKDKTGWVYIEISSRYAQQIKPDTKVGFRVKGLLDQFPIQKTSLLPSGNGNFILPFNATMRKGTGKNVGDKIKVQLELDARDLTISPEFVRCLKDEPAAMTFFKALPKSHQNYFSKLIDSAKTKDTKAKRIAMAVIGLSLKQGYNEMIRANKKAPNEF